MENWVDKILGKLKKMYIEDNYLNQYWNDEKHVLEKSITSNKR